MNKPLLVRPFDAELVRTRPGKLGKSVSYVETWAVIERLNEACDAWDFHVERFEVLDAEVVVLGRLVADGITKTAFGGSALTFDRDGVAVSVADDLKAAASDALKKCASLLGVGLELYGAVVRAEPQAPSPKPASAPRPAPADTPAERATVKQIAAIHTACRRHGYGRDGLAALVSERTGKSELALLTRHEASSLISELQGSNGQGH